MRANLLDELNKPYVLTARSKGLSERKLLIKYPVRVALNPFVSTMGWMLAQPGLRLDASSPSCSACPPPGRC